jgi:CelD/BcsL family acetyltransferase involved in cellulose biosynthesis
VIVTGQLQRDNLHRGESLRLLDDSQRTRSHYACLHAHCATATVYQTPAWLDLWKHLGADLAFVEVNDETIIPFVCHGQGALRRAYSLPFDTYGGPVTPRPNGRIVFENAIAPFGNVSARVVDFGLGVSSLNGAARPLSCHIVDLSAGYSAAAARYHGANQRLIRQAEERGVRISVMNDEASLEAFYRLHLRTVARYGARPFPRAFFRALFHALVPAQLATFYLAHRGSDVVAGNLVLRWGGRASDWMWVYDDRYLSLRATNLLLDRAIRDEAARGSVELNLGSSPNDRLGSVRFKQSFGAQPFNYTIYTHTMKWVGMARQMRTSFDRVGARLRLLTTP